MGIPLSARSAVSSRSGPANALVSKVDMRTLLGRLTHCRFNKDGLAACQLRHHLNVRKVELSLLRHVRRCEHITLERLAQESLDYDLPSRNPARTCRLPLKTLRYPASIDEDFAASPALQWCKNLISILSIQQTRSNKHFLVMSKTARGIHSSVVEVWYDCRVNGRRQGKWISDQAVFESGNKLRLPSKPLHLPAAKTEGREGDDPCLSSAKYARHGIENALAPSM